MVTLTIRLPDDKHLSLKKLSESKGLSINKLIEELSTIALVEFDTHTRFKPLAAKGDPKEDLKLLDKVRCTERIKSTSVTYHKSLHLREKPCPNSSPPNSKTEPLFIFK